MSFIRSVRSLTDPLRLPEEIAIWKARERENAAAIRSAVPELEPVYVHWLADWERVLDQTRKYALELQRQLSQREEDAGTGGQELGARLLEEASNQSRELGRQLLLLRQHSEAVKNAEPDHLVFACLDRQADFAEEALVRLQPADAEQTENLRSPEEEDPEGYDGGPEPADGAAGKLRQADKPAPEVGWSAPTSAAEPASAASVPIGGHTLPPLPYTYNALEPYIDEKTMRIHHDKHHLSYVEGLNTAEKKLEEARKTGNFELVKHWERELAFNGAGHYLHTLFWNVMSPKGGGKPTGALLDEINRSFGSYDAFKRQFSEAAGKVEGGGWAILVWSPRSRRLEILTAEKHQNLSQWDVIPLLPLDVWEHAYYLKHQNDRAAYVKDWWNVVNWPYVAERFAKASTVTWAPY